MGNFSSIDISTSGLFAQRVRMDVIANNIANATTTRTESGGPYRKQEVIFRTHSSDDGDKSGVEVEAIVESTDPPKMVYDPSNPDAGADGMVAMPDVNIMEEMVDMIAATRAYEANVTAINSARAMVAKALEIGRG